MCVAAGADPNTNAAEYKSVAAPLGGTLGTSTLPVPKAAEGTSCAPETDSVSLQPSAAAWRAAGGRGRAARDEAVTEVVWDSSEGRGYACLADGRSCPNAPSATQLVQSGDAQTDLFERKQQHFCQAPAVLSQVLRAHLVRTWDSRPLSAAYR